MTEKMQGMNPKGEELSGSLLDLDDVYTRLNAAAMNGILEQIQAELDTNLPKLPPNERFQIGVKMAGRIAVDNAVNDNWNEDEVTTLGEIAAAIMTNAVYAAIEEGKSIPDIAGDLQPYLSELANFTGNGEGAVSPDWVYEFAEENLGIKNWKPSHSPEEEKIRGLVIHQYREDAGEE